MHRPPIQQPLLHHRPCRHRPICHHRGMLLADLLLTVALLSILAVIAVPSFTQLVLEARMTDQVNALVHGIHLGKQSARIRLSDIALCKSIDGQNCAHDRAWHDGWILFENRDRDHPPSVGHDEPVLAAGAPYTNGTIMANRLHFVFRPFVIRSTNGTLTFCDRRGAAAARALIISPTGRPRTAATGPGNRKLSCPG